VLFLELQTLREASELADETGRFLSLSDVLYYYFSREYKHSGQDGNWVIMRSYDRLTPRTHVPSIVGCRQVRFNTKTRSVEMKTSPHTLDTGALQKGADFVSAFMLGFEVQDAVALLRLDDLYVESFQVTDVKMLRGDHLSRAIGRVAGQDGKTRFAIENATRTRIVIADQRIHLLGSYANLRVARNAICDLILGAPPGKVYNSMRNVAKRMSERY